MTLSEKLKASKAKLPSSINSPVWKGPSVEGMTQSLVNLKLACNERFRLKTIEGLSSPSKFEARMEYGSMWHVCEECHAANRDYNGDLLSYCKELAGKFPFQQEEILKWYKVCLVQFPIYVEYWKNEQDVVTRTPLFQEEEFAIQYKLPSGRYAILRGKFDSVDIIEKGIYLQENKTKADIDDRKIQTQLLFDLQTMYYLVALHTAKASGDTRLQKPILGIRYNNIKRPLSGGAGSIRQHKATSKKPAETSEDFYVRLGGIIKENAPTYFSRWRAEVDLRTIAAFKDQFLNPFLENTLDDYKWWSRCKRLNESPFNYKDREKVFPYHRLRHYRTPYGIYNPITEGTQSDLDYYLDTGSTVGLEIIEDLFPELRIKLTC